jgi:hypothetical protein
VPLIWLRGAREEVAKTAVLGIHPPTNDLHRWAYRAHAVDSSAALSGRGVAHLSCYNATVLMGGLAA